MSDDEYRGPTRAVSIWLGEVDRRMIAAAEAEEQQAMQGSMPVMMKCTDEEADERAAIRKRRGEALMAAVRTVIAEERGGSWK